MSGNKDFAVIGEGRSDDKTYAVIQNLTNELSISREKYKDLGIKFNEMVTMHNELVDAHDALLGFLKMQCGVLYTAITGDIHVDDPLKTISKLMLPEGSNKDLCEYRQGICIYVKMYEETGDPAKAFEAYQNYLGGIM